MELLYLIAKEVDASFSSLIICAIWLIRPKIKHCYSCAFLEHSTEFWTMNFVRMSTGRRKGSGKDRSWPLTAVFSHFHFAAASTKPDLTTHRLRSTYSQGATEVLLLSQLRNRRRTHFSFGFPPPPPQLSQFHLLTAQMAKQPTTIVVVMNSEWIIWGRLGEHSGTNGLPVDLNSLILMYP